ncbi:MAG: NAD(P)-binding domain-containing protein, partial [Cytophagia bacterium]|nr:NAD(P)-binding domain-containing protein [Cytophagia bacterium]
MSDQLVGVIGAGSFGTAVANILAKNVDVLLYARNPQTCEEMEKTRISAGQKLEDNVEVTNRLEDLPQKCNVLFPVIPSSGFRDMISELAPHLRPYHMMIHGTKGLHLQMPEKRSQDFVLNKDCLFTMSELIRKETVVV